MTVGVWGVVVGGGEVVVWGGVGWGDGAGRVVFGVWEGRIGANVGER